MSKKTANLLNRLYEEDENQQEVNNQSGQLANIDENGEINPNAPEPVPINLARELALEQEKLRESIDVVFKAVPYCEPSLFSVIIDNDRKRVDFLEQLLINRLVYNDLINEMRTENNEKLETSQSQQQALSQSVAEYANYLASVFNTKNLNYDTRKLTENKAFLELAEQCLFLSNLYLTSECLDEFRMTTDLSRENRQGELIMRSKSEKFSDEENSSYKANLNKITFICLTKNNLKRLPVGLISAFANLEIIDLSQNQFESVDLVNLCQFRKLREINLSGNLLRHFKPNLVSSDKTVVENFFITSTRPLSSDSTHDDEYKVNIKKLSETLFLTVQRLNLSGNSLVSSQSLIVSQFKNLKYLNLSNNHYQISSEVLMPWQIMSNELHRLNELDLSKNNKPVAEFSTKVATNNSALTHGSSYSLSSARLGSASTLTHTSKTFRCLTNLRVLNLSENNLKNMPRDIKELKHLEELDLSRNLMEFLPSELAELRSLKTLLLSENQIQEFTDIFCAFAQFKRTLQRLDLSKNQLKLEKFSYKIALFEELKELNLSENQFEQIPCILPKNLETLNFNKNKIRTLMTKPMAQQARSDEEILAILGLNNLFKRKKNAISKMTSINLLGNTEEIELENKKAKELMYDQPEVDKREEFVLPHVFYLRNLKQLHLANNNIIDVPHDFSILNSNLELLDLSFNQINQVGVSLCRGFSNLKWLSLESNRIRELSDKLCELNELEYLNLSNNRLSSLNFELCFDLKRLRELHLSGNFLERLPLFRNKSRKSLALEQQQKQQNHRALTPSQAQLISSLNKQQSSNNTKNANKNEINATAAESTKSPSLFTFNLPQLAKIDLSKNKFKTDFSLFTTFALCSRLTDIDLSSNKIIFIDTQNEGETTSDVNLMARSAVDKNLTSSFANDSDVKNQNSPKLRLVSLKFLNLSNNEIYFSKGGFIRMMCNIYSLAPNLETLIYDQLNGTQLGIDLNAPVTAKNANSQTNAAFDINKNKSSNIIAPIGTTGNNNKISDISINSLLNNNTGQTTADLLSVVDDDFYFDFNEKEEFIVDRIGDENEKFIISCYERMLDNLKTIDLSNNNLTKIPAFVYKLKNLKQIYFNGNLLKRIPNELYKQPVRLADEIVFEKLKLAQIAKIKEELKRKKIEIGEEEEEEEEVLEEDEEKKNKNKKKTKKEREREAREATAEEERKRHEAEALLQRDMKLVSESLEVIHLNNNQIEYVPDNLFSNFKRLKEIKLLKNPLRDPPQESVCISAKLTSRNSVKGSPVSAAAGRNNPAEFSSLSSVNETLSTSITVLAKSSAVNNEVDIKSVNLGATSLMFLGKENKTAAVAAVIAGLNEDVSSLPNLFFESNDYLKPLQSYMTKYKNREDMILCNMFVLIKDNIDSIETLYKLMRRLKMPMERVDYVCKEISDSVTKNWKKIAAVEYPIEPGKLRLSRRELKVKMKEYILKLQAWNLLNAWRNTFGTEAQSDEIVRILKLMNSNQFENELYQKLVAFKLSSNMFRV